MISSTFSNPHFIATRALRTLTAPEAQTNHAKGPFPVLARLPLHDIIRSYLIMAASSSPILLNTSMQILRGLIASKARILDVDRNPVLRWFLRKTFYAQFCAGETKHEVQHTVSKLRELGYDGMVLEYASEVLEDSAVNQEKDEKDINTWRQDILETVRIANEGDFVAFK